MKIISDKKGKIIQFSEFSQEKTPSVNDKFILSCKFNDVFVASHKSLGKDRWCPICKKRGRYYETRFFSKSIYGKRMTQKDKQKRLMEICNRKGAKLQSAKKEDGKFNLQCHKCKKKFILTDLQILRNVYLCPKKCVKAGRYTYNSKEINI
ncbi:MAG: hypothetical protein GY729_17670 [Desulfobacteraceae bacterium]|nr:hypothetical protein [Desulfobacteraceae bacterium]